MVEEDLDGFWDRNGERPEGACERRRKEEKQVREEENTKENNNTPIGSFQLSSAKRSDTSLKAILDASSRLYIAI